MMDSWKKRIEGGCIVYIGDVVDLEDTIEHRKGRKVDDSQPPAVTRPGRMVN